MSRPIPTNIIIEMNRRGFNDFDIIRYLRGKGYTPVEINDAMNHAKIKIELAKNAQEVEEEPEQLEPRVRMIAEDEVEINKTETEEETSKAQEVQKEIFDEIFAKLKRIEDENKEQEKSLETIKEQLPRLIQQQYSSIKTLNAEVQALQQTFSKVLEPLAHNVKVMSGMLDMPKEEKSTEKVEKEIKELEVKEGIVARNVVERQPGYLYFVDKEGNVKKTKAKGGKRKSKKIVKTVTVTETKPAEKAEKPKKAKSKGKKEKTEKSKIVKTTVTRTEVKKVKKEPSLDDIF